VFELSVIEGRAQHSPGAEEGFRADGELRRGQALLEENDGAGNTFKATAKPVLIGTAVWAPRR
jgi:K(+)-stimulated pyrophosphate-energized sodium pump